MRTTPALMLLLSSLAPARAQTGATGETPVQLNPFEVIVDSDSSYGALNSNSITRFNTELDKLPVSADIFDQAFMNDVNAQDVESMITSFSAGAGFSTSDPSSSSDNTQPGDRNGNSYLQLRGLQTPVMQRDGFMPVGSFGNPGSTGVGYTNNFDIERVEIINGPQALLYGGGGAGGVVNVMSKQARLGKPSFGNLRYTVDQYGHKLGELDYGAGTDKVAVRIAVINQSDALAGRRVNVGGPLNGYYAQIAFTLFGNTLVRVNAEQTTFNRINSTGQSYSAASAPADPRTALSLHYLAATNETGAINPATGAAYPNGPIDNGFITRDNIDSFEGWWASELTVDEFEALTAETRWNSWLTTQFAVGYNNYYDDRVNVGSTGLLAPNVSSNPVGEWAIGLAPGDVTEPAHTKAVRASAVAVNDWFGGRVRSQSVLGVDYIRTDGAEITHEYVTADSSFAPLHSATGAYSAAMPKEYWSVARGPILYPLFAPRTPYLTFGGANYVRVIQNQINPAYISPGNPEGVASTSGDYLQEKVLNRGIYGANYSNWLRGKLDTLAGFRYSKSQEVTGNQGSAIVANPAGGPPMAVGAYKHSGTSQLNFDAGLDYAIGRSLHPYVSVSDSFDPPPVQQQDPYGHVPQTGRAIGEEAGIKVQTPSAAVSGSVAIFHTVSKNEEYLITSTLATDINPSGLNGRFGSPSTWINVDRNAEGVHLALTAAPTPHWRLRLSAAETNGTVGTSTSYGQLYNDQFNQNTAGQVTYADGTVVYVLPTYNSKTPVVAPTAAGAIPLTITSISTPGNAYFASPNVVTGQITSSALQAVLKSTEPAGAGPSPGSPMTGVTGLPISKIQLNTALAGLSLPGTIITSRAGDFTTGYPHYAANLTSVYSFSSGWLKGIRIGGTAAESWQNRYYYYYTSGVQANVSRVLFYSPQLAQFSLIGGYTRKFRRVTWQAQVNCANLFNHYYVRLLPNAINGWQNVTGLRATYFGQPRLWTVTNRIEF